MNKHKKIFIIFIVVFIGIICYSFLFGKLFPFSPIVIGFNKHEFNNTIIYVQNGSNFNNFNIIDTYTSSVESFHKLKFLKKPVIYIFSNNDTYFSRTITKARFYAYPNGSLVISPWAIEESKKGIISLEIYIKHELSHVLLYQNMGLIAAYYYPQWLMEGIAVYSTNQMGTSWYPDKKQTYDIIKKGVYFPPYFYKTNKEDELKPNIENPIAFMYSEFACIVDYLIEKYGKDKFYKYMNSLFTNYNHNDSFKKIYNTDFNTFLADFIVHAKKRLSFFF